MKSDALSTVDGVGELPGRKLLNGIGDASALKTRPAELYEPKAYDHRQTFPAARAAVFKSVIPAEAGLRTCSSLLPGY